MYASTKWLDHVTQYPNRRRIADNGDGTVNLTKDQGEIIQQGTPQSATNFNNIENGVSDASVAASVFAFYTLQTQRLVEDDPDDYDFRLAGRLLAFGNLQQQRANGDALEAVGVELERVAETSSLAERDDSLAAGLLAFGNLQQQRLNDARFDLIASEALGESHEITLNNTQKFPFNSTIDNPVTVALTTRRKNLFYSVEAEITAHTGPVGEIRVTGKQLNGFKVSFDGCGKSVTVILRVKGGMSHG